MITYNIKFYMIGPEFPDGALVNYIMDLEDDINPVRYAQELAAEWNEKPLHGTTYEFRVAERLERYEALVHKINAGLATMNSYEDLLEDLKDIIEQEGKF